MPFTHQQPEILPILRYVPSHCQPSPPTSLQMAIAQNAVFIQQAQTLCPYQWAQARYQYLALGPYRDWAFRPDWGQCVTAAPTQHNHIHASHDMRVNNHHVASHPSQVGPNAQSGVAGGALSPRMPHANQGVETQSKQGLRVKRKWDDLAPYVVSNDCKGCM